MPRAISKCPQCGEPVSPFAAGCAICGADLDAARARLAARRRPAIPAVPAVSPEVDWVALVVAVVLAIAFAPLGFVLSLYWANQRYHAGESLMLGLMLATAALSVAAFFAPMWFWSHLL